MVYYCTFRADLQGFFVAFRRAVVYNWGMDKQKPQAQAQAKPQPKSEQDILSYYDLDTVLKHAAEGKKQIERGEFYTPEQARVITRFYADSLKGQK